LAAFYFQLPGNNFFMLVHGCFFIRILQEAPIVF